jgi:signal peptidase I
VLGDNSPVSEDSRTWPGQGVVDAKLLIGKPLAAIPSAPVSLWGWRHFQVPNPLEMRYIR